MKIKYKESYFTKGKSKTIRKSFHIEIEHQNIYEIIFILLFINLFVLLVSKNEFFSINYNLNYITLKINGTGNKNVFHRNTEIDRFNELHFPDIIYINDEIQNEIKYQYNFEQTENNVTLIWNRTIDICAYMFILCPDIIEIDLSNFNASQVVTMTYMFGFCYSLTSINLTNFNTSKVTKINRMFEKVIH